MMNHGNSGQQSTDGGDHPSTATTTLAKSNGMQQQQQQQQTVSMTTASSSAPSSSTSTTSSSTNSANDTYRLSSTFRSRKRRLSNQPCAFHSNFPTSTDPSHKATAHVNNSPTILQKRMEEEQFLQQLEVEQRARQEQQEELARQRKNDLRIFEEILRAKLIDSIRVGQWYELLLIGIIAFIVLSICLCLLSSFRYSKHVLLLSIATVVFFLLSGSYAKIQKPKVLLNQMNRTLRVFHVRFNLTKMKLVRLKTRQNTQPTPHSAEEIATSFGSGIPGMLDGVPH